MKTKKQYPDHKFMTVNTNIFESINTIVRSEQHGCSIVLPHVCNNIDLYGAGFAAQVANNFPKAKIDYHLLGKNFLRNNFGYAQIIKVYQEPKYGHCLYVANMIAQNGVIGPKNPRPLNYFALVKAMNTVSSFIVNNTGFISGTEKVQIHCPKFGSGLAGGNWYFISDLIDDIWSKFSVVVYNYIK